VWREWIQVSQDTHSPVTTSRSSVEQIHPCNMKAITRVETAVSSQRLIVYGRNEAILHKQEIKK